MWHTWGEEKYIQGINRETRQRILGRPRNNGIIRMLNE